MSIALISDVHVKNQHDDAYEHLLKFLRHPTVKASQEIFLLGDIFDLMCGPHRQYKRMYKEYFEILELYLLQGKVIHYFEGNHDMHLNRLFKSFIKADRFILHTKPFTRTIGGKRFFFCHGDEIEVGNPGYKRYKAIVTSKICKFLANYIVPYSVITYFGERASESSRKRSYPTPENFSRVQDAFRLGAKIKAKEGYDVIVAGHSHIEENHIFEVQGRQVRYVNNGFALQSGTFLLINGLEIQKYFLREPSI